MSTSKNLVAEGMCREVSRTVGVLLMLAFKFCFGVVEDGRVDGLSEFVDGCSKAVCVRVCFVFVYV